MRVSICVAAAAAFLAVAILSCGSEETTGVPETGEIRVAMNVTGPDPDPDGCVVSLDGGSERQIVGGGEVVFSELAVGSHILRLTDLAENCTVAGENPRAVAVEAGVTSETTFQVVCMILTGALQVVTLTMGDTLDAQYTVVFDTLASQTATSNDTVNLVDLQAGDYSVELTGVAANCRVSDPNPRTVTVRDGEIARTTFGVSCVAAFLDRIAFSSDRYRAGWYDMFVMKPDGSEIMRLTSGAGSNYWPAWSPDGSKIAFTSNRDDSDEIWVMNYDGSYQARLTSNSVYDGRPAWSPDGTKIAYTSSVDGNREIYVMNADGSGKTNLTNHPALDQHPTWSPGGGKIAFMTERNGFKQIYVMEADGSNPVSLTTSLIGHPNEPAWSRDGTKIAYSCTGICVMNADGSGQRQLLSGFALYPTWSPDGTRLAFMGWESGADIFLINLDGSGLLNITQHAGDDRRPSWSPGR